MKKKALQFWNNHASQYIWLHHKSEKKYKIRDKMVILLNMIVMSIIGFYLISDKEFVSIGCFFSIILSYSSLKNDYRTKSIYHNIAKRGYKLFLDDINQDNITNDLLLVKKLELNRLINTAPDISQEILDKYNKKFPSFPLNTNFTKTKKKYNLYNRIILLKTFNKWYDISIGTKYNIYSLGPLYGRRKFFFQFQNIKLNNNNIEISIE